MRVVGVRDLKVHLSELLEAVAAGETIEVTNHGRRVARIVPIAKEPDQKEISASLESIRQLAEEIGRHVPPGITAEDIINDIRN
jgi:prevent-host-death family protein